MAQSSVAGAGAHHDTPSPNDPLLPVAHCSLPHPSFDPCAASAITDYGLSLHIACVLVVLFASFVGVGFPLLAKCASPHSTLARCVSCGSGATPPTPLFHRADHPGVNIDPYYVNLGKCMGTVRTVYARAAVATRGHACALPTALLRLPHPLPTQQGVVLSCGFIHMLQPSSVRCAQEER